ncbi:MAG TPA: hypothetical protein V6D48_20825 [Oculatellaceae cyanobacterium]
MNATWYQITATVTINFTKTVVASNSPNGVAIAQDTLLKSSASCGKS